GAGVVRVRRRHVWRIGRVEGVTGGAQGGIRFGASVTRTRADIVAVAGGGGANVLVAAGGSATDAVGAAAEAHRGTRREAGGNVVAATGVDDRAAGRFEDARGQVGAVLRLGWRVAVEAVSGAVFADRGNLFPGTDRSL